MYRNGGDAVLFVQTLWEREVPPDEGKQEKESCCKKGGTIVDRGQQSTKHRANERTDACRTAQQTKVFAAVLWFRDISDIAKQDTDVAASQAIDNASEEE